MDILHRRWGRPVSDAVAAGMRVWQTLSAPALKAGQAVLRFLPMERLVEIGGEEQQAANRIAYNFFSGIGPELANPGGSLPGANRWGEPCDPEHPVPVILVHGTAGGGQTNWGTYVPLLTGAGFSVFTLTYGALPGSRWPISALGGMARIEDSAAEFGAFAERVMASTGASQVDVVGHSQGTLVPNHWAKFLGGRGKIRRYVSLAPLWEGTSALRAAQPVADALEARFGLDIGAVIPCQAAGQMMAGSHFIAELNADGGPYVPGIAYTNISTVHDELVRPLASGQVAGRPGDDVTNIVLQDGCPRDFSDHLGICGSPRAAAMVLNALEGAPVRVVPCRVVAPFFGTPLLDRTGGAPEFIAALRPSRL